MVKRDIKGRFIKGSSPIPTKNKEKFSKIRSKIQKKLWENKEYREKMSILRKGRIAWNKGLKGCNSGINNPNWRGGISNNPYSVEWTETLRRSIRERDHYTCQLCNKQQGDKAHTVHHIDYNKQNCNPKNLITLCVSCNSKVNANRDYWTKYFNTSINLNIKLYGVFKSIRA